MKKEYKPEYLLRKEMTRKDDEKRVKEGLVEFEENPNSSEKKAFGQKHITVKEYAAKYNLHPRTVQIWCSEGRIEGVFKFGTSWAIPDDAPRPKDHRYRNGEWVGYRKRKSK